MKILLAWLGRTDLDAADGRDGVGVGPIARAAKDMKFDAIRLLSNYEKNTNEGYRRWLTTTSAAPVEVDKIALPDPTDFAKIYEAARTVIERVFHKHRNENPSLTFHLSPGTPSMAAVWILIAKTRYPAELIQTSKESGSRMVSVPFDISAEYIPDLIRRADEKLESLAAGGLAPERGFGNVLYQSSSMRKVVLLAERIALQRVAVLIEGESGTGKEVFANAIHQTSPRHGKPFVTVNCGAIPEQLIESELFGHKKGAFTGADRDRTGHFVEADGGTIFLDEIGELPRGAQVKLLRVLQEREVTPVGSSKPQKIDVRVISATNRSLIDEVAKGTFRDDLFYRLAVFVLNLPPLRNREGDLNLLINEKLRIINEENGSEVWLEPKKLTPGARSLLLRHSWPGNVRELEHTLLRAAVISDSKSISEKHVSQALFRIPSRTDDVMNRPLGDGFDIQELLGDIARKYLRQALDEANSNKSEAAKLVGLPSYQTLTNWIKKYRVSG